MIIAGLLVLFLPPLMAVFLQVIPVVPSEYPCACPK